MRDGRKLQILLVCIICVIACQDQLVSDRITKKEIDSTTSNFWQFVSEDYQKALNSTKWVIRSSRKIKYLKGESLGLGGLAVIYEKKGIYDSAIFFHKEALKLRTRANDSSSMASSYMSLAYVYSDINQPKQVWNYLGKAFLVLKNSKDTLKLIHLKSSMAMFFVKTDNLSNAKYWYKEAMLLANNFSNIYQRALNIEDYGNILNQLNKNDSALIYYNQCLQIYKMKGHKTDLARLYGNMALAYMGNENRGKARYYLDKGYFETKKLGDQKNLESWIIALIDYWEEEPNLKKSNAYLHELLDLKDSVFKNNLEENIANIEKDYTVKLKNEENEKLKSEIKRKNTIRNAAIITAALLLLLAFYQYRIYRQKRNLAEQQKQLKENEIDQLLQERGLKNMDALLEGRETERKRIGRDLHDRLGSILSTVKLHFSAIDDRIDTLKKENQVQYQKASALLDEAVGEVRKIAQDLVSGVLVKYGLMAALNDMKNTLEATGKIKINLFEAGTGDRQDIEFEIAIYRIVQELMSNILKHAEATKVDIHLTKDADQFTLIVEDNGKGFNPENPEKFGMGMANIKQRVATLGGIVTFDSKPGAGATVIIEISRELGNSEL